MSARHYKKEEWINFWDVEAKPVCGDKGVDISTNALKDYVKRHNYDIDVDNCNFMTKHNIRSCIIALHTNRILSNNYRKLHHLPKINRKYYRMKTK